MSEASEAGGVTYGRKLRKMTITAKIEIQTAIDMSPRVSQ
jgi:hypothetical protein